MSTKLMYGIFIALATTALFIDDCIFINIGDEIEEDDDRQQTGRHDAPDIRSNSPPA